MNNLRKLIAGALLSCALVACDTVSPNAPTPQGNGASGTPAIATAPAALPQNGTAYPGPNTNSVSTPYPTP